MIDKDRVQWGAVVGLALALVIVGGVVGALAGVVWQRAQPAEIGPDAEYEYYRGVFDSCVGAALAWLQAVPEEALAGCNKVTAALYDAGAYADPSPNYISPLKSDAIETQLQLSVRYNGEWLPRRGRDRH